MSAYKVIECEVTNGEYIVAALVDMGIPRNQIETHDIPVSLRDYQGRTGKQKANIVVRRENFKRLTSSYYSADLGFEKTETGYKTHINSEESRWWSKKEPRFKQVASTLEVTSQAKRRGYHVKKVEKDGKIKLSLSKNY